MKTFTRWSKCSQTDEDRDYHLNYDDIYNYVSVAISVSTETNLNVQVYHHVERFKVADLPATFY